MNNFFAVLPTMLYLQKKVIAESKNFFMNYAKIKKYLKLLIFPKLKKKTLRFNKPCLTISLNKCAKTFFIAGHITIDVVVTEGQQ